MTGNPARLWDVGRGFASEIRGNCGLLQIAGRAVMADRLKASNELRGRTDIRRPSFANGPSTAKPPW
jgi:hypothetical protein